MEATAYFPQLRVYRWFDSKDRTQLGPARDATIETAFPKFET